MNRQEITSPDRGAGSPRALLAPGVIWRGRAQRMGVWLLRSVGPIVAALLAGALLLLVLQKNPLEFYGDVVRFGILGNGWQGSLTMLAPLLILGMGLLIAFRAKLWNLGYDGQFLLAAVLVTGLAPVLFAQLAYPIAVLVLLLVAAGTGALWVLLPAVLRARFGTNEIITTLMTSFIGLGIANLLIKGVFQDLRVLTPQTSVIPTSLLLPFLPGTSVHTGLVLAVMVVLLMAVLTKRSAYGARVDAFGANPRAASAAGISQGWVIVLTMLLSGALIGLAAAVDMLGVWGYVRSNWNPGYGQAVLPFIFLARLRPLPAVPFILFYAVFATGGTLAAQRSDLSTDFLLVIVALILLFMAIIEVIGDRARWGRPYLPQELRARFSRLQERREQS